MNKELKIINIGGTMDVTGNLTVYETENDIVIVDCGIGFPDSDMPGVDIVIPDFSYVFENADKVKGIVLTHAHEDHLGAVPFLLKELNVPIYGNKLVNEFVRERLVDRASKAVADAAKFHEISSDSDSVAIGRDFEFEFFRMNHSVPDTLGFAIKTPQGLVLHIADFKVDWTPVLDKPLEIGKIAKYGDEGVLCLLSDCLGVTTEGYTQSEKSLDVTYESLFERAEGRQLIITTISSNISRMKQIISKAITHNRQVVLSGRSIQSSVRIARSLGYLDFDDNLFVRDKNSKKFKQEDLVYLIAGCYGQYNSALGRISRNDHYHISVEEDSMVVFSADPSPPGVREDVEKVQDQLTLKGAEVIYSEIQDNLHVSGHGTKGDIAMIAAISNPNYFMPIGGTVTKMRAYKKMVGQMGFDEDTVFEQLEGESVVFKNGKAEKGPTIDVEEVLMEGRYDEEVPAIVLKDREAISNDGLFVVIVPIDEDKGEFGNKVEVVTRGFIYVKESGKLVGEAKTLINNLVSQNKKDVKNWGKLKATIGKRVNKHLRKKTGRNPMVIVHGIKV